MKAKLKAILFGLSIIMGITAVNAQSTPVPTATKNAKSTAMVHKTHKSSVAETTPPDKTKTKGKGKINKAVKKAEKKVKDAAHHNANK